MSDPVVAAPPVAPAVPPVPMGDSAPPPVEPTNEVRTWLLTQPEELQNDPTLNNFTDFAGMARSLVETKRMVGDRVKLPDESTPPEEVTKFYSKLGVPEKPEGYEFTKVDVPAAVGVDTAALDNFKKVFHDARLTKTQADKIQAAYFKTLGDQHNQLVTEYKAEVIQKMEVLQGRWGDKTTENVDLAKRAFAAFANPALQAAAEREGWGNNPDFIELFYSVGSRTSEDVFRQGGGSPVSKTVDQAIKDIEAKMRTPEFLALPENDPRRKEALALRNTLYQQKYPQLD